ncbi:probable G-protein coupled receptor 25 [Narcine bancroftii]|uniref:probable G-protein coupled receptor 25 n=1 Tax=Narcine bancroftii TaxID=1343680 RepID=UPI003831E63C
MSNEEAYFNHAYGYLPSDTTGYSLSETIVPSYEFVDDLYENSCSYEESPLLNIFISVFYYLIFVIGSFGNIFVILIMVFKEKRRRRLVDTFVINLAIADLIFVFSLPLWAISAGNNYQWTFGNELCKISSYIIAVNRYSSIFFLTCMSIDRYLAIVKLLDFVHIRTQDYAMKISVVVWVTSMLLAIPSAYFKKLVHCNETYCKDDLTSRFNQGFSLIAICLTFALPVVVILFCYCSILNRLRGHYDHSKNSLQRRENTLKIIFAIVFGFILSWMPFNIFKAITLCLQFSDVGWPIASYGLATASCLAFINSCMNPIIYAFLDRNFRLRARRLFSCIFGSIRKRGNSFGSVSMVTDSSTIAVTTKFKSFAANGTM